MSRASPQAAIAVPATDYWEARARRFAGRGVGLGAVCSYGMPWFYNLAIHRAQARALAPWLRVPAEMRVLELGCGVGRWSVRMAKAGARVTGVDLSPTMIARAAERARAAGVDERCRLRVADLRRLELGQAFPRILGVTVLQHLVGDGELDAALSAIAAHLEPRGLAVFLEAAPGRPVDALESNAFRVRSPADYRRAFASHGLRVDTIHGVDPLPLKIRFLPAYGRWPRPLGLASLAALTALSIPFELWAAGRWVESSWHKIFIVRPRGACR